jgi:hypothetical protein
MRVGLGARTLGNILTFGQLANFNQPLPGKSVKETREIGDQLQKHLDDYVARGTTSSRQEGGMRLSSH